MERHTEQIFTLGALMGTLDEARTPVGEMAGLAPEMIPGMAPDMVPLLGSKEGAAESGCGLL